MAILDHLTPVGFEAIIDVVQVHAGHFADHAIEDARRKRFRDGVKARELPARYEIISLVELRQEIRNLFRIVLQVAVHSENDFTATAAEAGHQRRGFAKVLAETDHAHHARMFGMQFFQFKKSFISTAIIDKYDFIALTEGIEPRR